MSGNLFLFHRYVHLCHILHSTYKWYHTAFVFSFWLISLSILISRSIHFAANGIISFFFYDWKELISHLQGHLEPNHVFNLTYFSSLAMSTFHNEQSLPFSLSSGFCPLTPAWSLACHAHKGLPSYILLGSI